MSFELSLVLLPNGGIVELTEISHISSKMEWVGNNKMSKISMKNGGEVLATSKEIEFLKSVIVKFQPKKLADVIAPKSETKDPMEGVF